MSTSITPMGVPGGTKLAMIVGGTFDPPHVGHVVLPCRAREVVEGGIEGTRDQGMRRGSGGGWLVYAPAARSPHKAGGPVASDLDRARMVGLAIEGVPRAVVWTDEMDRAEGGAPSYTVETVERARAWLDANGSSGCVLRLVIGADQARAFHRWREPGRIIELAEPVVLLRAPDVTRAALMRDLRETGVWSEAEVERWGMRVVEVGSMDVSATEARALLAHPEEHAARLGEILNPAVARYAVERRLYG